MQRFIALNGVRLENANGLPAIQRTPEGVAMGNIPGWAMLADPDYVSDAEQWVRNRARPNSKGPVNAGTLRLGEFDNGATALNPIIGDNFTYQSTVEINPNEWSAFVVVQPTASSGAPMAPMRATQTTDELCLRLGIPASNLDEFIVYESTDPDLSNPRRASYTANFSDRTTPALMMACFSVGRGITLYDNGLQVVRVEDDKRPLQAGLSGENNITCLDYYRGKMGLSGMLNIDLSKADNYGYRRSIERFVMNKYGIQPQ